MFFLELFYYIVFFILFFTCFAFSMVIRLVTRILSLYITPVQSYEYVNFGGCIRAVGKIALYSYISSNGV